MRCDRCGGRRKTKRTRLAVQSVALRFLRWKFVPLCSACRALYRPAGGGKREARGTANP